jgi:exodeoxyribonuclease VII large subunit
MNPTADSFLFEEGDAYYMAGDGGSDAAPPRFPYQFLPPQKRDTPYTVSEINGGIARILEGGNTLVWVEGELSGFKRASSGHCYLRLKDESSQVPAVLWKQSAAKLKFTPEDGMQVSAVASIRVYQKGGYYQLDIHRMQPSGLGALYAAFLALKENLEKEGLFDPARKKPLPETVSTLGVITSKRGAALFDIVKVVRSRSPRTNIVVMDVPVQGETAAPRIARAIADMNRYGKVDCIIVGRGGGSAEDLWAFNEEIVARAIAASAVPVISAVGHEIDFTIADFVADVRAPTPSAAAEIAIADDAENRRYFESLRRRLSSGIVALASGARAAFDSLAGSPGWRRAAEIADETRQSLDEMQNRRTLALRAFLDRTRLRLAGAAARLSALSPLSTLARGYSVVADASGATVTKASQVSNGDAIRIYFHSGGAEASVTKVHAETNPAPQTTSLKEP